MSRRRYTEEFKVAAVRQVTVGGHSVPDVAKRLGVTTKSLYEWKRVYGESPERAAQIKSEQAENRRLKKELKRVTEERDILKKAAAYFAKQSG
jgi:transposase